MTSDVVNVPESLPPTAAGSAFDEAVMDVARLSSAAHAPVILITGPFGVDKLGVLHQAARADGFFLNVLRTEPSPGTVKRRMTVLAEESVDTLHQAADAVQRRCLESARVRSHLLVPEVDQLDDQSLRVLDQIMRRQHIGVLMTSSAPSRLGYRFVRFLDSERGLTLTLPTLTTQECEDLVGHLLEAPPTAPLLEYLCRCSGGAPKALKRMVREGIDEAWIATVGSYSAITRAPAWMDDHAAVSMRNRILAQFGASALHLLERIVLGGERDLPGLLADEQIADTVLELEEAGLLEISSGEVSMRRRSDRHSIVVGCQDITAFAGMTPEAVLHASMSGDPVDHQRAQAAALDLVERGLLDQARCVAAALPGHHWASAAVHAIASVAEGAPRKAVAHLKTVLSADPQAPGAINELRRFIAGVHVQSQDVEEPGDGLFADFITRLSVLERTFAHAYVASFEPPEVNRESLVSSEAASPEGAMSLGVLAAAATLSLDAYAAAAAQDRLRAEAALEQLETLPMGQLPLVGMTWVLGRVSLARILLSVEQDMLPALWLSSETAERALLRSIPSEAVLLVHDLLRGEPVGLLRRRLQGLWAQFEAGLSRGQVTRQLLEAFDYAVEGDRSQELLGPGSLITHQMGDSILDPWVSTLTVLGRLLHVSPARAEQCVEDVRTSWVVPLGVQCLVVRCVILRRASSWPEKALHALTQWGRDSGVEPAIVDYAETQSAPPGQPRDTALNRLHQNHPRLHVTRSEEAPASRPAASRLRADLLLLLSHRERQVAEQLITGAAVVAVAEALDISVRTVQTHVRHIYKKLGVNSRTELRTELLAGVELRP